MWLLNAINVRNGFFVHWLDCTQLAVVSDDLIQTAILHRHALKRNQRVADVFFIVGVRNHAILIPHTTAFQPFNRADIQRNTVLVIADGVGLKVRQGGNTGTCPACCWRISRNRSGETIN